jgi:hypothetical protein
MSFIGISTRNLRRCILRIRRAISRSLLIQDTTVFQARSRASRFVERNLKINVTGYIRISEILASLSWCPPYARFVAS